MGLSRRFRFNSGVSDLSYHFAFARCWTSPYHELNHGYLSSTDLLHLDRISNTEMASQNILGGAVASEHRTASKIGTDILRRGGNAVDAVIATIIAVNTLCPYHSDLGGGGFAIIRQSDGEHKALDFRHQAPVRHIYR